MVDATAGRDTAEPSRAEPTLTSSTNDEGQLGLLLAHAYVLLLSLDKIGSGPAPV